MFLFSTLCGISFDVLAGLLVCLWTYAFFLMMALHPEIQQRAQEEIDSVIGTQRLPNMHDKENLPYMNCIIKEVMRFATIVPLMPHSLDADDVSSSRLYPHTRSPKWLTHTVLQIYEGYLIPKHACVMVNMWCVS